MTPCRVAVLGGTGFVGRALCRQLATTQPGWRVRVPTRRVRHAAPLRLLPGVDVLELDVHDDAQLQRAVGGVDVVVNLVAILHGTERAFEQVHVALPRRLADACRGAGVVRLVHVSALGVGPDAPSMYLRSKARGEAALAAAGLPTVVLRPSVVFGAEDRFLNLFATLQAWFPVMPLGGAEARFQPVWVEDLAAALAQAVAGRTPALLECAGPRVLTLAELVRDAGRWSGHARPLIALPPALARLQAALLEHLPGPTLMSRDNVDSMRVPNVASGALPGLRELGIEPADVAQVMPDVLAARGPRSHLDALRRHAGR